MKEVNSGEPSLRVDGGPAALSSQDETVHCEHTLHAVCECACDSWWAASCWSLTCSWAVPAPPQIHFGETDPGQPCSLPEPVTSLSESTWKTTAEREEEENA